MSWIGMVAAAFGLWGHAALGTVRVDESWAVPTSMVNAAAWAVLERDGSCAITVNMGVMGKWKESEKQRVIAHEVGHCLGLGHTDGMGVMYPSLVVGGGMELTASDWDEYRNHYPFRYRLVVAW